MGNLSDNNLKDYEIRDAINKHGGRADNVLGSKFKPNADIPPFAKYKPVEYEGINPYNIEGWWKSKDMTCQIQINLATTLKQIEDMFLSGDKGWSYKYFSPSEKYPWRMGDFRGHNPTAKSAIDSIEYEKRIEVTTSSSNNVWLTVRYRSQSDSELKFSDIAYNIVGNTMDGWYAGFVYKTIQNSELKIVTTASTIDYDNINETILLPVTADNRGTMTLYPVMSQYPYTKPTNVINVGTYICPLPDSDTINIEVAVIVPYTITLDESTSYVVKSGGQYQVYATYNIKSTQNVNLKGHWYYTAVNADKEPIGQTVIDPWNGDNGWSISTGTTDSTETYTGTMMSIPVSGIEELAGIRVEFISEGYNFGGHIFNIR